MSSETEKLVEAAIWGHPLSVREEAIRVLVRERDEAKQKSLRYRSALNWIVGFAEVLESHHSGFVRIHLRAQQELDG